MKETKLTLTDTLALERTRLANERTFLSYFRTFIVLMSSGFAILKLEALEDIKVVGYFFIVLAPIMLIVGGVHFIYVKKSIRKHYK